MLLIFHFCINLFQERVACVQRLPLRNEQTQLGTKNSTRRKNKQFFVEKLFPIKHSAAPVVMFLSEDHSLKDEHTRTHTLSLSLFLFHTHTRTLLLTYILSLPAFRPHIAQQPLSNTLTLSLFLSLYLYLSITHSHTCTHTPSHSPALDLTFYNTLSLRLYTSNTQS